VEPTVTSPSFTAHLWLASLCLAGSVGMAGPASAAGASAPAPVELPPLTEPASGETHPGKMIWADLVTPDLKQAEQFYAALFGWSFEPVTGDEHVAIARVEGRPVAGIVQRPTKAHAHQPAWLTFLAVRDVAAADRSALANGGKVLAPPKDYPRRGHQSVLTDPDGAVFAVLASSSGDSPDVLAEPGEWIWSTLLARDTNHETGFYRAVFGYDVFDLPPDSAGDTTRHIILAGDDYARASIHALPADSVHRHPHWLNFVRVDDTAAAAVKAIALGGRVLVEPRIDRHGDRLAVIADPAGAPFGVMEWTSSEQERAPDESAGDAAEAPASGDAAPKVAP
jgi:predicted enzyme related to lactoylglutathione lyase